MEKTITLSDGKPCTVRVLGLFDLDHINLHGRLPGEFKEEFEMGGKTVYRKYVPPDIPPLRPIGERKDAIKGSAEWHDWLEYETYELYIEHRRKEADVVSRYVEDVAAHILDHCIEYEDVSRIVEPEDWRELRRIALSARLTREDLETALADTFPGRI